MPKTLLTLNNQVYNIQRYPVTNDTSLQAWSNAELLALNHIQEEDFSKIHLFNDRFGIWNVALNDKNLITVWTYASQQKSIKQNLQHNNFSTDINFKTLLDDLKQVELALVKIPKSLELFELFLSQIRKASTQNTKIICCFMTKYFASSYLKIASEYFEEVSQTKAWKKARLLILKHPRKEITPKKYIKSIFWKEHTLQQYYGVFSSNKIDIGTQFFLEHLQIAEHETKVLDVASGNGIIAFEIAQQNPHAKITLVDDFNLAIESSKINLKNYATHFICDDTLSSLPKRHFDLVSSNPPFHFEHENNIEVAISLFNGVKKCLTQSGRFVLVANKHLNYKTHLSKLFSTVTEIAINKKFILYQCKL